MASGGEKTGRFFDTAALARIASYHRTWTVVLDETSRIVYELGTCDLVFGGGQRTPSVGRRIAAFVHPDDIGPAVDRMEESLSAGGSDIRFEIRAGGGDGSWTTVAVRAVNLLDDEAVNGIILTVWIAEGVPA